MKYVVMMVGLAAAALPAAAGDLQLGIGLAAGQPHYRGEDKQLQPLPLVHYQGEYAFVAGDRAGLQWALGERFSAAAVLQAELQRFKPADNSEAALRQLDPRKAGLLVGAQLAWTPGPRDTLTLTVMRDSGQRHRATLSSLGWEHRFGAADARTQWQLEASIRHAPARYNRYYYGVSAAEASRNGLAAFSPDASLQLDAGVSVRHALNRDWSLLARVGVSQLDARHRGDNDKASDWAWRPGLRSGKLQDSPLLQRQVSGNAMLGVMYAF